MGPQRAETSCADQGAFLVVPRTAEQNQCALELAAGTNAWIGVTDRVTEGVFVAADGLGPLETTFWDYYSPNNNGGVQHCGELYFDYTRQYPDPGWNDVRGGEGVGVRAHGHAPAS
ncbi:Mannose-binding protein A [Amphibalanus amphitrite]|uniref:Mannose-binding protein A n=1 Tax=Amphibalanus amphitrite TaxID=1232801 RepID=A0A6A4VW22_AMPAM|nr:Mannose-binding protein A [Amphibalanus amphitrite]